MSASCKYVTSTRHCIIVEAYETSDRAIDSRYENVH